MCFKEGVTTQSVLLISHPQTESRGIQGRAGATTKGKIVAPSATQMLFSGEASDGIQGSGWRSVKISVGL